MCALHMDREKLLEAAQIRSLSKPHQPLFWRGGKQDCSSMYYPLTSETGGCYHSIYIYITVR